MHKSIDTVVAKTKLKPVTFKFHPLTAQAVARYAEAESQERGYRLSQSAIVQQALEKDKAFQPHLKAVKEEYDRK